MIEGVKYNSLVKIGAGFFSGYHGKVTEFIIPEGSRMVDGYKPSTFKVLIREKQERRLGYTYCIEGLVHISEIEKVFANETEMNEYETMLLTQSIEGQPPRPQEQAVHMRVEMPMPRRGGIRYTVTEPGRGETITPLDAAQNFYEDYTWADGNTATNTETIRTG